MNTATPIRFFTLLYEREPSGNEHGDADSIFHTAVEKDSLIAILWHISYTSLIN